MATANFAAARKQAEDAGMLGGGDIYKYKEGDNRIRLMSLCLPHQSMFQGKPNFKWLCYVLDRRDGKVKVHFMPHKIYKAIEALQDNPDYTFENVPMPYDITISAKGAGTKEVEYSVIPARRETALTDEEQEDLDTQKPLGDVQKALIEKAMKGGNDKAMNQDTEPSSVRGGFPGDDAPPMTDEDIHF